MKVERTYTEYGKKVMQGLREIIAEREKSIIARYLPVENATAVSISRGNLDWVAVKKEIDEDPAIDQATKQLIEAESLYLESITIAQLMDKSAASRLLAN